MLNQGKIMAKGAGYEVFESSDSSEITFKTGDHLHDSRQSLETYTPGTPGGLTPPFTGKETFV